MFGAFTKAPLRWKVLIGGQALITLGLIQHRLQGIKHQKALKEARKAKEAGNNNKSTQ